MIENLPAVQEIRVQSLGQEDLLEKGRATHSRILAWRIPMDRRAWPATVHGVAKSRTQQRDSHIHFHLFISNTESFFHLGGRVISWRPKGLFRSVQSLSDVQLFATSWSTACQASLSITKSWVYSNSCPLSPWCHLTISSSVVPFSSFLQSFPTSGSFKWVSSLHQVAKILEFQL